jgi:hypothetical protein
MELTLYWKKYQKINKYFEIKHNWVRMRVTKDAIFESVD